jgi:hypothetical protein
MQIVFSNILEMQQIYILPLYPAKKKRKKSGNTGDSAE